MKETNIYGRLAKARVDFLKEKINKSGLNSKFGFTYYELQDFVPTATRVFEKNGLVTVFGMYERTHRFEENTQTSYVANLQVLCTDTESEPIEFTIPFEKLKPIISKKTGEEVTNTIQLLGATQTYLRRYLWMQALDLVEHDSFDNSSGLNDEKEVVSGRKIPKTTQQRQEIKEEIISTVPISDVSKKALGDWANKLKKYSKNRFNTLMKNTNNLNDITTQAKANTLINQIREAVFEYLAAEEEKTERKEVEEVKEVKEVKKEAKKEVKEAKDKTPKKKEVAND